MKKAFNYCIFLFFYLLMFFSSPLSATAFTTEKLEECIKVTSITPPTGTWYWSIDTVITNTCSQEIELRDAIYSIETPFLPTEARISFDTSGMSWAATTIINQTKGASVPDYPSLYFYTNTMRLDYGTDSWLVTKIKPGGNLILTVAASLPEAITFSQQMATLMQDSFKVFTSSEIPPEPILDGSISIKLDQAPVADTDFPKQASFNITGPDNYKQQISISWGHEYLLSHLALGSYSVHSVGIEYHNHLYQASLPDTVSLTEENPNSFLKATYTRQTSNTGIINLQLGSSPKEGLSAPDITVYDLTANSEQTLNIAWGSSLAIHDAVADHQYQIEAQPIDGYTRTAQPSSFTLQDGETVNVSLEYMLAEPSPAIGLVSLTLNGLPVDQTADISFINNETQKQTNLNVKDGQHEISLAQGIYTVSAAPVDQYQATMVTGTNPLTVSENSTVSIAFQYDKTETAKKHVVAYFTAWGIYGRDYQVTDIPALKVTDINYAFLNISNGECVLGDAWADIDKHYPEVTTSLGVFPEDSWSTPQTSYFGNFNRLNKMRELAALQGHQVNLFLSVGGWTWSKYFSDVAATSTARKKFVNSCLAIMNQYQFDGIDLDWEYPVGGGLADNHTRPDDKQNYTLLLKLFREKMGQNKLLTIAAPAGPSIIPNLEWDKLSLYVDWVNLMSYDFHGSWDNITGHNAGLYANPADPAPSTLNADSAINRIASLGYPVNKLIMGVGFYGRGWGSVPSTNNGLFQSGSSTSSGTWESGVFDYHDLVNNYYPTYGRYTDSYAKVPYLYNPSTGLFISYEDPQSMTEKAHYIQNRGLLGVMFWELSGDIRDSNATHSLLGTLHNSLNK